jgi:predicted lipid-binding transport protein (Tim44 family)
MKYYAFFIIALMGLTACTEMHSAHNERVEKCANAFAEAYFNYDFMAARELVTPESEKWLRFAASNMTQEDIDMLNASSVAATTEVSDITTVDDSTAIATIKVKDFLQKDSIGRAGKMVDEAQFELTVIKRDKQYFVRMEGLPRSEKQSRD